MRKNNIIKFCIGAAILFGCFSVIFADEPLEKPADKIICSPNRKFCVDMDYEDKQTTAYQINKQGKKEKRTKIWEMPGWFYNASLANDGEHLIIGNDWRNLVETNYKPDQIMLSFYRKGELFQQVKFNQLIENFAQMPRTVSHYAWCKMFGLDENGYYSVTTFEDRRFLFDPATGQPVNIKLLEPSSATIENNLANPLSTLEKDNSLIKNSQPAEVAENQLCLSFIGGFGILLLGEIFRFHR